MINFILPYCFNNYNNNQKLLNDCNNCFYGVEGNIPFQIFTGRVNNNKDSRFLSYYDILDQVKAYNEISNNLMLIDFGNSSLEPSDYYDSYGEVILEEYADKKHVFFEVADENFIEYLVDRYPNIQIVLHENYTIFHSEKDIKALIKKFPNNIKGINITVLNLCENIDIQKFGILNLDSCYYCPQFPLCLKNEHKNVFRYREASSFNDCTRKQRITLESALNNLKILLKYTNEIICVNLAYAQIVEYMELIEEILKKELEGALEE